MVQPVKNQPRTNPPPKPNTKVPPRPFVDNVNHPPHYTQGGVECIDAIKAALGKEGFLAFLRGQVIKYNWRLGLKGDPAEDSKKAAWYQARLTQELESEG